MLAEPVASGSAGGTQTEPIDGLIKMDWSPRSRTSNRCSTGGRSGPRPPRSVCGNMRVSGRRPGPLNLSVRCQMEGTVPTVEMFRPVGPEELGLVRASGFTRWPPRLPEQPIFYPVTNAKYAAEIAERWNVKDSGSGAVTRFFVRSTFMDRYPIQRVGASYHTEWWVPAEDLDALNDNIVGRIEVFQEFGA